MSDQGFAGVLGIEHDAEAVPGRVNPGADRPMRLNIFVDHPPQEQVTGVRVVPTRAGRERSLLGQVEPPTPTSASPETPDDFQIWSSSRP